MSAFLVSVIDRLPMAPGGEPGARLWPLTQIDIADYLATTPESVCRGIRQLRERRIIAQPARDIVVLQDRTLLQAIASGTVQ